MYTLKLIYDPPLITHTVTDSITHAATVDLFLQGIHCVQLSDTVIAFESESHRLAALLALCHSTLFTPRLVN
jgi:hypothetical protein